MLLSGGLGDVLNLFYRLMKQKVIITTSRKASNPMVIHIHDGVGGVGAAGLGAGITVKVPMLDSLSTGSIALTCQ